MVRLFLVWLALSPTTPARGGERQKRAPMSDQTSAPADRKKEQDALLASVLGLARSDKPADQAQLVKKLEDRAFLDTLDTEAEVQNLRFRIRIERVLEALGAANASAAAQHSLVALTTSATFLHEARRTDGLIRATAIVRPAPPALVHFWEQHSRADDGFTNLTIHAAIENGSPPAIAFFEGKMLDHQHDADDKTVWLHTDVLSHRNDPPLLAGCERLLAGHLAPALKSALIDSLFDYRPDEWYGEAAVYTPPDRTKASVQAHATLDRIAYYVLTKLHPTKQQEEAIERATGMTKEKAHTP
jgi:hypothetical protein